MGRVIEHVGSAGVLEGPCRVGRCVEDVSDRTARTPAHRVDRNEARGGSSRHRDGDLLASLDPTHQFGCVLPNLSEPDLIAHAPEGSTNATHGATR